MSCGGYSPAGSSSSSSGSTWPSSIHSSTYDQDMAQWLYMCSHSAAWRRAYTRALPAVPSMECSALLVHHRACHLNIHKTWSISSLTSLHSSSQCCARARPLHHSIRKALSFRSESEMGPGEKTHCQPYCQSCHCLESLEPVRSRTTYNNLSQGLTFLPPV